MKWYDNDMNDTQNNAHCVINIQNRAIMEEMESSVTWVYS